MSDVKIFYDWSNAEEAAKVMAEVRREGYEAGVNDERLTHVPGWEDWMKGNAKGYIEGLEAAAKLVCMYCDRNIEVYKGFAGWYWHDPYVQCEATDILKLADDRKEKGADCV